MGVVEAVANQVEEGAGILALFDPERFVIVGEVLRLVDDRLPEIHQWLVDVGDDAGVGDPGQPCGDRERRRACERLDDAHRFTHQRDDRGRQGALAALVWKRLHVTRAG